MPGAAHFFEGHLDELKLAITDWTTSRRLYKLNLCNLWMDLWLYYRDLVAAFVDCDVDHLSLSHANTFALSQSLNFNHHANSD